MSTCVFSLTQSSVSAAWSKQVVHVVTSSRLDCCNLFAGGVVYKI